MLADLIETAHFRKLQKTLVRRDAHRKVETSPLRVTFAGGCYRARIEGQSIVSFGETPSDARQRLYKLLAMRGVYSFKKCDLVAERKERAAERAAANAGRRSARWNPRGHSL